MTTGHIRLLPISDDICILQPEGRYLFTKLEKYPPNHKNGTLRNIVRVIKKPLLTAAERQQLLQQKQREIEQQYILNQQQNDEEYANCNDDYDKIVNYWQTSKNIKTFCNDIKHTYSSRYCLGTKDDNDKCKTLTNLLYDCYKQEPGSKEGVYVTAFGEFK